MKQTYEQSTWVGRSDRFSAFVYSERRCVTRRDWIEMKKRGIDAPSAWCCWGTMTRPSLWNWSNSFVMRSVRRGSANIPSNATQILAHASDRQQSIKAARCPPARTATAEPPFLPVTSLTEAYVRVCVIKIYKLQLL